MEKDEMEMKQSKLLRLLLAFFIRLRRLLLALVLALVAGLVHLVEQAQRSVLELIGLLLDLGRSGSALASLALGDELTHGGDLFLDFLGLSLVKAVLKLLERLLGIVNDAV